MIDGKTTAKITSLLVYRSCSWPMSYEVPLRAFCLLVLILYFFYLSSIIPQLFSLFSIWGLGGTQQRWELSRRIQIFSFARPSCASFLLIIFCGFLDFTNHGEESTWSGRYGRILTRYNLVLANFYWNSCASEIFCFDKGAALCVSLFHLDQHWSIVPRVCCYKTTTLSSELILLWLTFSLPQWNPWCVLYFVAGIHAQHIVFLNLT